MRLIQEQYRGDAWKVLVSSLFLKRTRGDVVEKIIRDFFKRFPHPQDFLQETRENIEELIRPLGLWRNRAKEIKNIASWLVENGTPKTRDEVLSIKGAGGYVADSYSIFVLEDFSVSPKDEKLKAYLAETKEKKGR